MDCSTPGLPVHHQLPEFTQTHVHRVGNAIQPSHPLSSPSPPAFNLSQHQGLFQWVSSLHQVVKVLRVSASASVLPMCIQDWFPLGWTSWISRRRQWQATPVLLPRKSHGWRSLVGCSPWGRYKSEATERLHFHFSPSHNGEGNGNPLQCSCLENPRDGRAWWAAVYGVAQSWTRLKRLSSSSSSKTSLSSPSLKDFLLCFILRILSF